MHLNLSSIESNENLFCAFLLKVIQKWLVENEKTILSHDILGIKLQWDHYTLLVRSSPAQSELRFFSDKILSHVNTTLISAWIQRSFISCNFRIWNR